MKPKLKLCAITEIPVFALGLPEIPAYRLQMPGRKQDDRQTFSSGTFSFRTFSYRTFSFSDIQLYGTFSFLDIQLLGHSAFGTFSFWDIQLLGHSATWTFSFWDIQLLGHPAFGTFSFLDIQLFGHSAFGTTSSMEHPAFWTSTEGHKETLQITFIPQELAIYIQYKHIFSQLTYIPKMYIPPTLCPKGTRKPSKLHSSPKSWHYISNTNIYLAN